MTPSSTSLQQFLTPPPLRPARQAVRKVAASFTAQEEVKVRANAERLESRVEEKEGGYWVLKEKFRAGINSQEKVKLEKDPMSLVFEDGIRKVAATPLAEIEACKSGKDDIDVRLKWLGLFHRRKHHCTSLSGKYYVWHRHVHWQRMHTRTHIMSHLILGISIEAWPCVLGISLK
ncbi:ferredoxin--nitrite reductase, chloroplastic-like [Phalaenopsis equestris]|uniref:ferredoxin--nitrite reductase, chloroplastic-like n=1 Tax=Phalaenopsis equestris TaxID=78828 RepID=UPI0009E52894|nr:ferredoxin--nitrite reductase, chloroplastic-like [Phalaenopsis equestris]